MAVFVSRNESSDRLLDLSSQWIEQYVGSLLLTFNIERNFIVGTLSKRLDSSVPRVGFIRYDLRPVLVP